MSDYFSRLADRALGQAEVLAPRVPYRFETGAPREFVGLSDESGNESSYDQENSSPAAKPQRESTRPSSENSTCIRWEHSHGIAPQPVSADPAPADPPKPTREPQRKQRLPAPMNAPLPEPTPQSAAIPPPPTQLRGRKSSHTAAPNEIADARHREEIHQRDKLIPVSVAESSSAPIPRASQRPLKQTLERRPAPSPANVLRTLPAETERPIPVLQPRRKDERISVPSVKFFNPRGKSELPKEPSIKVTIGRVEVRAIMEAPKPAPKPRQPEKKAISLDDFLKRQKERRR